MKLDSRILEGKKPLDCFDAENEELIKPFLNKEGYVSNNLENFCLLDGCFKRLLSNVFKKVKDCFKTSINGGDGGDWKYFLPAEWVKEPEVRYRPFSIREFEDMLASKKDDFVCFRFKFTTDAVANLFHKLRYLGYVLTENENYEEPGEGCLYFANNISGSPKYLFEHLELLSDGKWIPFGVLEVKE